MEEALAKYKSRRKPLHRKIVRKRSVLRNGTELLSFSDFMAESEDRPLSISSWPTGGRNAPHEVRWLKNKISNFEPEYTAYMKSRGERHGTKPKVHKHILDLERQIKERGGVPDNHPWIKRD
jgi:hypothetical protein